MKNQTPKAPEHLSKTGRAEWRRYHAEFGVDDDARPVLLEMLEALDRKREAQGILQKEGVVIEDRFGQKRQHPAVQLERDSRLAALRAMRMLGIPLREESEKRKPGRPTKYESLQRVK